MSQRFLPAEWDPQSLLCLTWPHSSTDWRCCFEAIQHTYCQWVKEIVRFQRVLILHRDPLHRQQIQSALREYVVSHHENIFFTEVPTNDTWIRDYGPIVVFEQNQAIVCKFEFNGWGQQFEYQQDNQATKQLFDQHWFAGARYEEIELILEGGNIDSNGNGHLLSNFTSLVINARRQFDKSQLASTLCRHLGVDQVHWLEVAGLPGDDTHGHIDTLCRFINPDTIVYCSAYGASDPGLASLQQLQEQLAEIANQTNFQLVPVPRPALMDSTLAASYINFVIINGALLVPQYGHEYDQHAIDILAPLVADREVIGVDARTLIRQSGALHCASAHIPKFTVDENRLHTTA